MANAVVGDDIYKDCPTTNALQSQVAELLGKEAALFTSSGTQANLINMMLLAPNRAQSVIMGDLCHVLNYERGGVSLVGSIMPRVIPNEADGTLDLTAI
jgi:threonine aldolase